MLREASDLHGYAIDAVDGQIGHIDDVLFEDDAWIVRWVVVDAGGWLGERKVLLPPQALEREPEGHRRFKVALTRQQVKDSPDIDTDQSVSRRMEAFLFDHYGWSPYWGSGLETAGGGFLGAGMGMPYPELLRETPARGSSPAPEPDDGHLRSVRRVANYRVHAIDGDIGHLSDLLLEDQDWSVAALIVDLGHWLPGRKVLVADGAVKAIEWAQNTVQVDLDRGAVKASPGYERHVPIDPSGPRSLDNYNATVIAGGSKPTDSIAV